MKKQTLVILAIIAVITTTLLTVNALSNEVGYKISPCDAIDISLENTTVTDFLNATNMTTVHVYNFKGYKGENTWMVQWFSSNRLLNVHVNVATGNIVGIEEKPVPEPTPTPTPEAETWHSVDTFYGKGSKETTPFSIKGNKWRVKWNADGGFQSSAIHVEVYKIVFMNNLVDQWRSKAPSSGTLENYEGPGKYFFYVTATDLDYWELKVEDYY